MAILRDATPDDASEIAKLVQDLAQSIDERSPINSLFVKTYLRFPGCGILVAEEHRQIIGLLSYSVRPNLYHNGDTAQIEELIVKQNWRGQGLGSALLKELFARLQASGCVEVAVSALPDNEGAIRFYRSHGLVDEAIYLEKHL